jgi:choline dehydrogenase-like flavoprotein
LQVRAEHFILAVGGFETAHLLLAANRQIPAGIGNESGLVGRYFMDHPKFKRGRLYPGPAMKQLAGWTRKQPRPRFHISLSLNERTQAEKQLLDHAFHFSPVYTYQVDYPKEAALRLKRAWRGGNLPQVMTEIVGLLASPKSVWKLFQKWWYRDVAGPVAWYAVQFYVEQAPNPESRLLLSSEKNALGMPRLAVDWRLNQLDHDSFRKLIPTFIEACAAAGLGRLEFGPERFTLDESTDGAHHIGATRMGATPETGVVDRDCKVFGLSNLFIASSSVFPTGHSAAPTMTIIALARRLGHHLIALHRQGGQEAGSTAADASGRFVL